MIYIDSVQEMKPGPAVGYQAATVCVPVTVTPFATVGATTTTCRDEPIITEGRPSSCDGLKNGSCFFTITQNICVAVPVEFGAAATAGDPYVAGGGASADEDCGDCGDTMEL